MRGEGLWAESRAGGSEGGSGAAPRGEGLDAGAVSGLGWRRGRRGTGDRAWMEAPLEELGGRGRPRVRLLFQSPPPAAPPVWSLRAPSAEPWLPALRFLRPVFLSLFCSDPTELGAAVPAAASPAEWEVAPWRGPGLPPQTGGHLSRVFSSAIRL